MQCSAFTGILSSHRGEGRKYLLSTLCYIPQQTAYSNLDYNWIYLIAKWISSTGWNINIFILVKYQNTFVENVYTLLGADFGNGYDNNDVNASRLVWTCYQTVVLWCHQLTLGGRCCGLLYPMWERDWCLWRGINRKGRLLLHLYV